MDTLRALRVLGLPPGAGAEEIKTAWRDLARVWHPDRFGHDARLQRKAGDNLKRINEAYEALRDYDPARSPKLAARVRESVAMFLGIGELGEPPPVPDGAPSKSPPPAPSGPVGARSSVRVLGLGLVRHPGHSGARRRAERRFRLIAAIVATLLAVAGLVMYLRS